ncbi:hypothetical protein [Lysinibacillus sphaericus]|uniref:Uncharacterized protein n=1 Tax=Lysinibacillus sphaericus OT4b.31 TaxID=1285586 RepID=R7ZAT7_LYSSH|nr:hypothetical protein H131_17921 [Lysinibacillus sphaericus OT4b.31]
MNRELLVQAYYPAEKGTGHPSPYFENIDALTEQLSSTQGFPYIATGFFDKNLKGTNEHLLEEIQKNYPEINLAKH